MERRIEGEGCGTGLVCNMKKDYLFSFKKNKKSDIDKEKSVGLDGEHLSLPRYQCQLFCMNSKS